MADDVRIRDTDGGIRVMRGREMSGLVYQSILRTVADDPDSPSVAKFFRDKASNQDTFTTTGNGALVDVSAQSMSRFGIQVKGTGATPTSWTVVLEGSLNGTDFSTLLTHTNITPGHGLILHSGAMVLPVLYFRARCSALSLGSATNIVVTIVGIP